LPFFHDDKNRKKLPSATESKPVSSDDKNKKKLSLSASDGNESVSEISDEEDE